VRDTGRLLGDVWQLLLLKGALQNLADVLLDAYLALNEDVLEHTHAGWVHPGTLQKFYASVCILSSRDAPGALLDLLHQAYPTQLIPHLSSHIPVVLMIVQKKPNPWCLMHKSQI